MKYFHAMKLNVMTLAVFAAAVMAMPEAHAGGTYPPPSDGGGQAPVLYSGRATVIDTTVKLLTSNTHLVLGDTGNLEPSGATRTDTVLTLDNPAPLEVHSRTVDAVTSGAEGTSASSAEVEKLLINLPGLKVTADVLEAHTTAICDRPSMTVATSGGSTIANLSINGKAVPFNGKPNQKIKLGVATIILNEQYRPDVNTQVVNALHVQVPGAPGVASADVIVSHAESGILTCPCND